MFYMVTRRSFAVVGLAAALGRALNRVQDIRLLADYDAEQPSREDAQWAVEQAAAFVAAIQTRFQRK